MNTRLALIARLGAALEREGDPAAHQLLEDALAAIVEAEGELAVLEKRRAKDRRRKKADSVESTESTVSTESLESTDSVDSVDSSAPPSPSPSFPGPHITPSSPPSVQSASQPGALDTRRRFFAGKDDTAIAAWEGRFRGAIERDGWSERQVVDALEDLMATKPREEWTPVVFRAYLGRLKRSAEAEASRDAAAASATAESERVPRGTRTHQSGRRNGAAVAEAQEAFARVRELIEDPPRDVQGGVAFIRPQRLEALGTRYVAAVRRIGGVRRIIADVVKEPGRIGLVLKDWTEAWPSTDTTETHDG